MATKIHFQKEVRNITVRDKEAYQLGDVSCKMCEALVRYLYRDPDFEGLLQLCTSEELSELKKLADELQLTDLVDDLASLSKPSDEFIGPMPTFLMKKI